RQPRLESGRVVIELKKPGVPRARVVRREPDSLHSTNRHLTLRRGNKAGQDAAPHPACGHLLPSAEKGISPVEAERETLFWLNALLIALNGMDSRVSSLTAHWEVLAHGHLLRGASARAPNASSAKTNRVECRQR